MQHRRQSKHPHPGEHAGGRRTANGGPRRRRRRRGLALLLGNGRRRRVHGCGVAALRLPLLLLLLLLLRRVLHVRCYAIGKAIKGERKIGGEALSRYFVRHRWNLENEIVNGNARESHHLSWYTTLIKAETKYVRYITLYRYVSVNKAQV